MTVGARFMAMSYFPTPSPGWAHTSFEKLVSESKAMGTAMNLSPSMNIVECLAHLLKIWTNAFLETINLLSFHLNSCESLINK